MVRRAELVSSQIVTLNRKQAVHVSSETVHLYTQEGRKETTWVRDQQMKSASAQYHRTFCTLHEASERCDWIIQSHIQ